MKKLLKKINLKTRIALLLIMVFLPIVIFSLYRPFAASATWFDDAYAYRQRITFTHNAGLSDRRVEITIDTETLINEGKMQADCDDTRFTDLNGKSLLFELTGSCDNAATTYDVVFPTVISGSNIGYVYYGNPGAQNASQDVSGYTSLSPSGGAAALASQEKGLSPIAYWGMDEGYGTSTNDSTLNNNDGVITGSLWQTEDKCIAGKCLYYDGSDDVVTVTNASAIDLDANLAGGFSVSSWIRPNGAGESSVGQIFFKGTNTWLRVDTPTTGTLDIQASLDLATTDATLNVATRIQNNKWNYVSLSYTDDADDEITIWVNGVSAGTSTDGVGSPAADANNLLLGGTTTANFKGFIDEFKIYNYERTSAQVLTDFTSRDTPEGASVVLGHTNQKQLSDGLVGYWPMDESASPSLDFSGNGNSGTWANNTASIVGKYNKATDYDGTNDSTAVSDNDVFSANTTTQLTVSAWLYPDANSSTRNVISKGAASNFEWSMGSNADLFQVLIWNSGGSVIASASLSQGFQASQWQHFAFTLDLSSNSLVIFRNGAPVATGTVSGTYTNGTAAVRFGERADGSNDYDGKIDEVRIYNRVLSPKELNNVYNWAPSPVGYWKLDEHTGTDAFDSSANGYNGTLNGSTVWTQGKYGNAVKHDLSTTYITMGDQSAFEFPGASDVFTLTAWVNMVGNEDIILSKYGGSDNREYFWEVRGTGQFKNQITIYEDGGAVNFFRGTGANLVANGVWTHLAVVVDIGADTIKMYTNGVEDVVTTSGTPLTTMFAGSGEFIIGGLGTTTASDGSSDEIKVYPYARSAQQIIEDMNGGHPIGGSPVGSQASYWAFDELYGTTANNQIVPQSAITGTISGGTWRTKENCKINGCLDYDGSDDVTTVTNATTIDLNEGLAASFTIGGWIYADSDGEGDAGQFWQKGASTYCRTDTESAGSVDLECNLALGTNNASINVTSAITTGTWNHVMLGYTDDSDDEVTVWVNGKARGTSTNGNGAPAADANDLLIGGITTANFDGKIDEFKVYSTELTTEQITIDMNAGSAINFGSTASAEDTTIIDGADNPPSLLWNLDEKTSTTANDTTGNGNSGTLTNTPTWSRGKYGSAVTFAGSNQHITRADDADLDFADTDSFSIETWFKHDTASAQQVIVAKHNATAGGYKVIMESDGDITCAIDDDSTWTPDDAATSTAASYDDNEWHHVACVKNATTSLSLYIDGVLIITDASISATGTLANADAFYYGIDGDGTSNDYEGSMDQLVIYRYVRTDAQVAYDYNRGGPVGWWQFDEGINDSCFGGTNDVCDNSGKGHDGAITGTITRGAGKFNEAITFDPSDAFITVTDTTDFEFPSSTATFSFTAWVKLVGTADMIFSKYNGGGNQREYFWDISASSNRLTMYEDGGSANFYRAVGTRDLVVGAWTHVAIVVDIGADTITSYINGKADPLTLSGTPITTLFNGTASLYLGGLNTAPSSDGSVDDIRIYNYALSAAQVYKIMNDNAGARFGPSEGSP